MPGRAARALLVDLSGLTVDEPMALAVFTAVARQAARWPGTPVLLCAAAPGRPACSHAAAYRRLPRFPSVDAALRPHRRAAVMAMPTITEDLLPIAGAPRHGRNIATEACLRWDLPHLVAAGQPGVSELISNVVDHAHTMMTLRLSLRQQVPLHRRPGRVAGGTPVAARRPARRAVRGRGLQIVDATAHSWGCLPARDGKVVWASLRLGSAGRSGAVRTAAG